MIDPKLFTRLRSRLDRLHPVRFDTVDEFADEVVRRTGAATIRDIAVGLGFRVVDAKCDSFATKSKYDEVIVFLGPDGDLAHANIVAAGLHGIGHREMSLPADVRNDLIQQRAVIGEALLRALGNDLS